MLISQGSTTYTLNFQKWNLFPVFQKTFYIAVAFGDYKIKISDIFLKFLWWEGGHRDHVVRAGNNLKDTRVPHNARALFFNISATLGWDGVPAGRNQRSSKVWKYRWLPGRSRTTVSDWSSSKLYIQLQIFFRWGLFLSEVSTTC